jgi:hypothetical protein
MRHLPVGLLVSASLLVGCYHATIETGATPSTTLIENHWASGWVFGLVPPKTVATAAKCPSGVAKVETQLSFVNQLVSFLTIGIYTPMDIVVTCAEAPPAQSSLAVPASAPLEAWHIALAKAATTAIETHAPVYVTATR